MYLVCLYQISTLFTGTELATLLTAPIRCTRDEIAPVCLRRFGWSSMQISVAPAWIFVIAFYGSPFECAEVQPQTRAGAKGRQRTAACRKPRRELGAFCSARQRTLAVHASSSQPGAAYLGVFRPWDAQEFSKRHVLRRRPGLPDVLKRSSGRGKGVSASGTS